MNSKSLRRAIPLIVLILCLPVVTAALSGLEPNRSTNVPAKTTYSGTLRIMWGDPKPGSTSDPVELYFLSTAGGDEYLLDAADLVITGADSIYDLNRQQVAAEGKLDIFTLQTTGMNTLRDAELLSITPASAEGSSQERIEGKKPWISLLCKFSNTSVEPKELAYFIDMYSSSWPGLDHYWNEVSYGYLDLEGSTAAGWFEIPPRNTLPTNAALGKACMDAADDAVYFPDYDGINFMFNIEFDAKSWGGSINHTIDGVEGNWRATWENPWGYNNLAIVAHEMGHGFGLLHSYYKCPDCYDNQWDVMSDAWLKHEETKHPVYGTLGQHPIAYQKSSSWETNWLGEQEYVARPGLQTIELQGLARPSKDGYLFARVPLHGSNRKPFYTIEARTQTGYDSKLPGEAVILHKVGPASRNAVVVDIDGNGNTGDEGAMWRPGETFTDPNYDGLSIRIDSQTGSGFQVTIFLPDWFEPNDNRGGAADTSYGENKRGLIYPAGDVDYFLFTGAAGDEIYATISAKAEGSSLIPALHLLDKDGNLLAENANGQPAYDAYLTHVLPYDGDYFLRVLEDRHPDYGDLVSYYDLALHKVYVDGNEPNDDFNSATRLVDDASLTGVIDPSGDVDFFYFEGRVADNVHLAVGPADNASVFQGFVEIYDKDRQLVTQSDHGWINIDLKKNGRYTVKVQDGGHPTAGGGDYAYQINLNRSSGDDHEPNDSPQTAAEIVYYRTLAGYLAPPGDIDFFVFQGYEGHEVVIETDSSNSAADPALSLFNGSMHPLSDSDNYNGSKDARIELALPNDGRYYLKVTESDHGTAGGLENTYELSLTLIDSNEPNDTAQEATPIAYGEMLWGVIDEICGESDYFIFSGLEGQEIVADIDSEALRSSLLPDIALFASDGVTELDAEVVWPDWDPRLYATLPEDGVYYLRVRDACEFGSYAGPYTLLLERLGPDTYEPNDSFEEAAAVNFGELIRARLEEHDAVAFGDDSDVYRFNGEAGSRISAAIDTSLAGSLRPTLCLFDRDRKKVDCLSEVNGSGRLEQVLPETSIYYLTVEAECVDGETSCRGPYQLLLTLENQPPEAKSDSYAIHAAGQLRIAAPGVLGNDSDKDADVLTAILAADVKKGRLALNSDGSFTYIPLGGFVGQDSFTYRAYDGEVTSRETAVSIRVLERLSRFPVVMRP